MLIDRKPKLSVGLSLVFLFIHLQVYFFSLFERNLRVWWEDGTPLMALGRTQVLEGITGAEIHRVWE